MHYTFQLQVQSYLFSWSSFLWFLIPPIFPCFGFSKPYTNLRYGYTREVVAGSGWNYYVISSDNSMKLGYPQDWSRSGYLSEVSTRDSLRIFYNLGYIFQSDRRLVFRILNYRSSLFMLSIIRVFFIFSVLAHSQNDIKYAVQREFYCKAVVSVSIIRHRSEIYTVRNAENVYILTIDQSTWGPYL